ncbi:MAG: DUF4294 domain-containing protein [Candidatus Onthomorpha sp.]|nr:DUF4294 domain-containing protein [Bacteroidales bacterium]MDY4584624.1 DUF4294 domain-containing protein [Candidatus Onthomorpha sp.]MCI5715260.1 DUF4294 domain-containing protein [Bacteroidales bacterium]MCI6416171.1 DUF4294 domain-containing protein [Bacteroidales bacterium]MCI6801367.1 DUF4294 domain-containing protein [Bacteroidales bacterium]
MKRLIIVILLLAVSVAKAQQGGGIVMFGTVYQGDTIPMQYLDVVTISGYVCPLSEAEKRKYKKLIKNVKVVYPYAKQAGKLLDRYTIVLQQAKNDSQRKKIMKQAEKEIENKFGPSLKKLNRSQGKILIRLIDRETGSDSYALVKELRGSFRAAFYQTLGKLFGYNLRTKYDPENNSEDRIIERIIYGIETKKL